MTNLVTSTVEQLLPRKRKTTSGGWVSFDAVCCHHNGESKDKRGRGGIVFSDEGFSYHCFNCNYKAFWRPGMLLSDHVRKLLEWMHCPDDAIAKMSLDTLRIRENLPPPKRYEIPTIKFEDVDLPFGVQFLTQALENNPSEDCLAVAEYVMSRRLDPSKYLWTDQEDGFKRRFIIPFTHGGRIVGWTARSIDKVKIAKYLSNQQSNYVYGLDNQDPDQKWLLVTEGPLDADGINGLGLLHAELSNQQRQQISQLGPTPVLVPDRDKSGVKLAEQVLEHKWAISFPEWHDDVKDVADAVQRYGTAFTVASIIQSIETNHIKSQLKIRTLRKKLIDKTHD